MIDSARRLAIVATHPVQYYAPWYRHIQETTGWSVRVFYLWDFGVQPRRDPSFQREIVWDVPLLEGYGHEFVPNTSSRAGTDHFFGLQNPSLARQLRIFNPDVVLLQTYNNAAIARLLLEWREGDAPLLFKGDSHRLVPQTGAAAQVRSAIIRQVFKRMAGCLYVGAANRRYFEEHGVDKSRLHFSPHAVDSARFSVDPDSTRADALAWRSTLGIPRDHRLVLFAGKLEDKKRPLDLLDAFVQAKLPRTSLLFVGSGRLEQELRARAARHADVHVAPFQNQSAMPRTYAAADIFVLPSYGPGETWGLAINECRSGGTPVIVSTHVGCAEDLVSHGENGLIFPAGDVPALASSLREALSDDARLRRWGARGREHIAAYSYDAATEGLRHAVAASLAVRGATANRQGGA